MEEGNVLMQRIRTEIQNRNPSRAAVPEQATGPADVTALLNLGGEAFVEAAYMSLLGRPADSTGGGHYLQLLRSGMSTKADVVQNLASSEEARRFGSKLAGLARFLKARKIRGLFLNKIPLLGSVLSWLIAIVKVPRLAVPIRQLEFRTEEIGGGLVALQQALANQQAEFENLSRTIASHRQDFQGLNQIVQVELRRELEDTFDSYDRRLREMDQVLKQARINALDLEQRLGRAPQVKLLPAEAYDSSLDSLYHAFEEKFRGSREEIRERAIRYLPLVSEAGVGQVSSPILDVGCGRGEWLELLRDNGYVASGVDSNLMMVEESRKLGLSIEAGDVIEVLRKIPSASVGAVTGFHIVEHLPFPVLVNLLDEARRVLVRGGFILFETPNPENLVVGSCNFYYDPTHRNPLPPPLLQFLAEARGFDPVRVIRGPVERYFLDGTSGLHPLLNERLGAPFDYAVAGFKR